MLAIAPEKLACTVYLYRTVRDAEEGREFGGCGFVVDLESTLVPGARCHYVVTNRHVVDGGCQVVRINTRDGGAMAVATRPSDWTVSSDDDLALLDLAIPEDAAYGAVTPELLLGADCQIKGWPVFPGDEVLFFGRFVNHDGIQRNRPLVRYGNISALPDAAEPIRVGDHEQEAFLVECRSMSGTSGSPAFVRLADSRMMAGPGGPSGWIPTTELRLLGVVCGHLPFWAPVRPARNMNETIPDSWVETNSGVAVVVPAWKVWALLNQDEVRRARDEGERALQQRLTKHQGTEQRQ